MLNKIGFVFEGKIASSAMEVLISLNKPLAVSRGAIMSYERSIVATRNIADSAAILLVRHCLLLVGFGGGLMLLIISMLSSTVFFGRTGTKYSAILNTIDTILLLLGSSDCLELRRGKFQAVDRLQKRIMAAQAMPLESISRPRTESAEAVIFVAFVHCPEDTTESGFDGEDGAAWHRGCCCRRDWTMEQNCLM